MGDARNQFVANPINRYSVSDRTGLVQNPDGSLDIYIQNAAPAGHESNWLPAPVGKFILWLRVYIPGEAILQGKYTVPPVVEGEMMDMPYYQHLLIIRCDCGRGVVPFDLLLAAHAAVRIQEGDPR